MKCDAHLKCMLKCALDVSCSDMDVYVELMKRGVASVDEIAEALRRDNSTVYKSLQNLLERGLVEREYRILRGGGYKYLYKPVPFEKFREEVVRSLQEWVRSVMSYIDELEKYTKEKLLAAMG
ncbi:MAG: helix-turn-helix domain-containing protein [Archaeoglobaceae archaeon]